jgi:hypothetical protein
MIMERRYYKPELLNELRTEVFDKIGFKLLFVENHLISLTVKNLLTILILSLKKGDKRQHDGGVLLFYTAINSLKITGLFSTTAGMGVIDDKHSLLHNFVDTVYYKYLMNWT